MRFLSKRDSSPIEDEDLRYEVAADRERIKSELLAEQYGYCAYTEKFIMPLDSCEIEHFDPRHKGKDGDGYRNWYAVIRWVNAHKAKKIEPFLPIVQPSDETLQERIAYDPENSVYVRTDETDVEAENLLRFLGVNKENVVRERKGHIQLLQNLIQMCPQKEMLLAVLQENRAYLHFPTAVEAELDLELSTIYRGMSESTGD